MIMKTKNKKVTFYFRSYNCPFLPIFLTPYVLTIHPDAQTQEAWKLF